jgi:hypothetical protein
LSNAGIENDFTGLLYFPSGPENVTPQFALFKFMLFQHQIVIGMTAGAIEG